MMFDLVVLAILLFSAIRGASRGFVWQLAGIAAIVASFAFAETVSLSLAPHIGLDPPLNRWVSMLALYLFFAFMAFAIARNLRSWLERVRFVEFDHHLGALFGLFKGGLLSLVLCFFLVTLSASARDHIMQTVSGRSAAIIMDRLHPAMPDELHAVLDPYIHRLDHPDLDLNHDNHGDDGHRENDQHEPPPKFSPLDLFGSGGARNDSNPGGLPAEALLLSRLAELTGVRDPELHRAAADALRATDPEYRPELLQLLGSGVEGIVRQSVADWQDGRPDRSETSHEDRLLSEIAGVYFDFPNSQQAFIEETREQLGHLSVADRRAVLRDMYADVVGADFDPNPATDFRTPLRERLDLHAHAAANSDDSWLFR